MFSTYKNLVLAAGEERILHGKAEFFSCLDCNQQFFEAKLGAEAPWVLFGKGLKYRAPVGSFFGQVVIRNNNAGAMTVTVAMGSGELVDDRNVEAGPQSIVGSVGVVGQPLSTDGGFITPIGGSVYSGGTLNTNQTIFSGGSNTNGAIRRTAVFDISAGAGRVTLNTWDGVTASRAFFLAANNTIPLKEMRGERYIPAGFDLQIHINGVTVNAYMTWDYL